MTRRRFAFALLTLGVLIVPIRSVEAQAGRGGGPPIPTVVSPEVTADRKITFRVYAPKAQAVRLSAGDIPGVGQTSQFTSGEDGVWEITVGPVEPGAYRYTFNGTTTTSRYRFRAVVPLEESYPYVTGSSPVVAVIVRGAR